MSRRGRKQRRRQEISRARLGIERLEDRLVLAGVAIDLGSVAAGESVTVDFDVAVSAPLPKGLSEIPNQATLSGPGFSFATNSADVPVDEPPQITDVFVRSAAAGSIAGWHQVFLDYLGGSGLGDATYGFRIPGGADQLTNLTWTNLNQLSLRFSENVAVEFADLQLLGSDIAAYQLDSAAFSYDAVTFTATWELDATVNPTIGAEKIRVVLNGDVGGITDTAGSLLDGEWIDGTAMFPSGDGIGGGDFSFRFNVLPGDANRSGRVLGTDVGEVRVRQGSDPSGPLAATYSIFHDINGSGAILGTDVGLTRQRQGAGLPDGEPDGAVGSGWVPKMLPDPPLDIGTPPEGISTTKTAELVVDNDGDGLADVGDVIQYRIIVANGGSTDSGDVHLDDALSPLLAMVGGVRSLTTPQILSPGSTYMISGYGFTGAGSQLDLNLAQGGAFQALASVSPEPSGGSFMVEVDVPTTSPGGSALQIVDGSSVLASVDVAVLHSEATVDTLFQHVFGRAPNATNLLYWQARTDVLSLNLAVAMEVARQEYEAAQLKMQLFAFSAHGSEIPSPAGTAEDDRLQARFTNGTPGQEVSVSLVYDGIIIKTQTGTIGADGKASIDIDVPNPLLPVQWTPVSPGLIDVIMVHGDQATHQTLQLREGPRLLIKSGEVQEGSHMYFAIRGVAADEDVKITVRYDWGTGSREQTWTIGRTDGSNQLDEANSKLLAPKWITSGANEDAIEVDIDVGDDHRGYRVLLKKGPALDDIIANLIRTSGTSSIEAELAVLLTEEERILADQLLGDDWEGNAEAIGDKLDEVFVQGGGGSGDLPPGVSLVTLSCLLGIPGLDPTQYETYNTLSQSLIAGNRIAYQNELERSQITVADLTIMRPEPDYHNKFGGHDHLGMDYILNEGTEILSPVSGTVVDIKTSETYGTMMIMIEVELPGNEPKTFKSEYRNADGSIVPVTTNTLLLTIGHLRPSRNASGTSKQARFNEGFAELGLRKGQRVTAGVTTIGYIENTFYNGGFAPHAHISVVDANNKPPVPTAGWYPTGEKPDYLKRHIDLEGDWDKVP